MGREELEKKLAEATQAAIEANNAVQLLRNELRAMPVNHEADFERLRAMPVNHEADFERLRAMGFETFKNCARKDNIAVDIFQRASGVYAWWADICLPYADDDTYSYDVPTGEGATPEEALGALRDNLREMAKTLAEAAAKIPGGAS